MKTLARSSSEVGALYFRLKELDLATVPVVCTDRCTPRKEQAKMARELFKMLGLKGISVTTPNYSMASTVEVGIPELRCGTGTTILADDRIVPDEVAWYLDKDGKDYRHHCYSDMPEDVPAKRASEARFAAAGKVLDILLKAFPNHDDRSDSMTDYYDRCWSVS